MRFKTIAFALIVSSAVFILGCDDEDSTTISPAVNRLSFQVTYTPPLDSSLVGLSAFYINAGQVIDLIDVGLPEYSTATEFTTEQVKVDKGQEFTVYTSAYSYMSAPNHCSNVQLKALLNGSQFDVRTFNMGGDLTNSCPDGRNQSYNLIIP